MTREHIAGDLRYGAMIIVLSLVAFGVTWTCSKHAILPIGATLIIAAAVGIQRQQRRSGNELCGAIVGGSFGGMLSLVLHLVYGYEKTRQFEDEGLGFIGSVFTLAPYAITLGVVVGLVVWIVLRTFRSVALRNRRARSRARSVGFERSALKRTNNPSAVPDQRPER